MNDIDLVFMQWAEALKTASPVSPTHYEENDNSIMSQDVTMEYIERKENV